MLFDLSSPFFSVTVRSQKCKRVRWYQWEAIYKWESNGLLISETKNVDVSKLDVMLKLFLIDRSSFRQWTSRNKSYQDVENRVFYDVKMLIAFSKGTFALVERLHVNISVSSTLFCVLLLLFFSLAFLILCISSSHLPCRDSGLAILRWTKRARRINCTI